MLAFTFNFAILASISAISAPFSAAMDLDFSKAICMSANSWPVLTTTLATVFSTIVRISPGNVSTMAGGNKAAPKAEPLPPNEAALRPAPLRAPLMPLPTLLPLPLPASGVSPASAARFASMSANSTFQSSERWDMPRKEFCRAKELGRLGAEPSLLTAPASLPHAGLLALPSSERRSEDRTMPRPGCRSVQDPVELSRSNSSWTRSPSLSASRTSASELRVGIGGRDRRRRASCAPETSPAQPPQCRRPRSECARPPRSRRRGAKLNAAH
mmetsp:Transcript_86346/g.249351  ORF Transcript_86346/g.249351 Transcript_86346/m.249351 type:complete len:271 (+) Transcript_86346:2297-3109(+)